MGVGNYIFGPNRLLTSNCVIDVESSTPAPAGGTQHTWAAFASSVDVLLTQAVADQNFDAGVNADVLTYTVSGVSPALMRSGVRYKVVTCPDLPDLVGRYLSPQGVTRHPAGRGGLLRSRLTARCTLLQVPGDDGTE